MTVDLESFRYLVEDFDLSDEKKDELLQIMNRIALHFVDLGWGVEDTQLCLGKVADDDEIPGGDLLGSLSDPLKRNFKFAAHKGGHERPTDE